MIDKVVNKYRIDTQLGEDEIGVIYKAWDTDLERPVALKMIHHTIAQDERFSKSLDAAVEDLKQLNNRYIVRVYGLQKTETELFMVMQYTDGFTLADKIKQTGAISYKEALTILKQILHALDYAHQDGILHGNLKPSNVIITQEGVVKITGLGLAKIQQRNDSSAPTTVADTLIYMAPEQIKKVENTDRRNDIYALGMTCYELLTGKTPFETSSSPGNITHAILAGNFPPPHKYNPDVPAELSKIVMKAISINPEQRFQTAKEMLRAIRQFETASKPQKPRGSRRRFLILILSIFIAPLFVETVKLMIEYWTPYFNRRSYEEEIKEQTSKPKLPVKEPQTDKPINRPPVSEIIRTLAAISDVEALRTELEKYYKAGQITVGKKKDFEPPDGCYVFIVDDKQMWGVYRFDQNVFYAINSDEQLSTLSSRFSGKRAIWVKDQSTTFPGQ